MISETDLIVKNNNIYHIDVNKDNVAKTIILVGDPDRVQMVSKYFDTITHKSQHREFVVHTGTFKGKELSVISTGIGPDNIDIVINELDAIFNVNLKTREINEELVSLNLIRLGTCGTMREDIPIDSIIVSDYGMGLDNLLSFYDGGEDFYNKKFTINKIGNNLLEKLLAMKEPDYVSSDEINYLFSDIGMNPYIVESDISLRELFKEHYHGITVTCPGFYGPQSRNLRIKNNTQKLVSALKLIQYNGSKPVNFEMETSALYGLSKLSGHKALTLCTVVANRITKEFSKNAEKSVDNMIRIFLNKIILLNK